MTLKKIFFGLSLLVGTSGLWAIPAFTHGTIFSFHQNLCLSEFYRDVAPELINSKLKTQSYALCFNGFTVQYSGVSKTPLWVAEKLTPERLSHKIARQDSFHEEPTLPVNARALLSDYRGSGYDRGHMAPNGDMGSTLSQHDSFSLVNIIPQTPENNQNTWREIEESTRAMVNQYQQEVYVVTGPAFLNAKVKYIQKGHDVLVPSHVYKAIYIPKLGIASAYLSANDRSYTAQVISICDLEERVGINIFPALDENTKRQIFKLPMRSNQVKVKQTLSLLATDLKSQCAPEVDQAQIALTQQKFVRGRNEHDIINSNVVTLDRLLPSLFSKGDQFSLNQVLLWILHWLQQYVH